MLKGHATIDLHDTVRGTYKRFEKDNLVTNAYKYHLQSTILMNCENNAFNMTGENGALSIAGVTLGGLLLFDGALTENAENIHYPGDVHIVGYSDQTTDLSNPRRGSYNTLESGKTGSGYTHVWDFSTAQGNGIIGALSLTNIKAGADPIGNCINRSLSGSTTSRMQYQYHDGVYGYYFSISGSSAKIEKYFQPQSAISVHTNNLAGDGLKATYTVDMSEDENAILETAFWQYAGNGDFYGAIVLADNSDEHEALSVRVAKIHTDDWATFTYTPAEDIELDGVTGRRTYHMSGSTKYIDANPPVISGHHVYIPCYQHDASGRATKIYIADLNNPSNIIETTDTIAIYTGVSSSSAYHNDYRCDYPGPSGTADFWEDSGTQKKRIRIYPDGTVMKAINASPIMAMRGYASKNAPINAHWSRSTGSNWGVYVQTGYLGTICNLTSPIEKTAAQTMKVTYTLTDVL